LYAKARAVEIAEFTGISSPYSHLKPELLLDTGVLSIGESVEAILG
jgi:adenylylsulfate kinase